MHCFRTALGCLTHRNDARCAVPWPVSGRSVALLIVEFPRPMHPLCEFDRLLELLRTAGGKCTFFFTWQELRRRGTSARMQHFVRDIAHEGHQIALRFEQSCLVQSSAQLRQEAVEALHYAQRVFGTTVSVAMVPCASKQVVAALEPLGLTTVSECCGPRVLGFRDDANLLKHVRNTLLVAAATGRHCVRLDDLLDEI